MPERTSGVLVPGRDINADCINGLYNGIGQGFLTVELTHFYRNQCILRDPGHTQPSEAVFAVLQEIIFNVWLGLSSSRDF